LVERSSEDSRGTTVSRLNCCAERSTVSWEEALKSCPHCWTLG